MKIEIINTGSELLLGTTLNTHGAWMGTELIKHGLRVQRQTTVPDGPAIIEALSEAMSRSDVVIVSGGLGPTSDDISREAAAEVLGVDLIEDEAALRSLEAFFAKRNRVMVESNRKQALNPVGGDILPNPFGTAPGIYTPPRLSGDRLCALFLLPGPPGEMKPMFTNEVIPKLCALADTSGEHLMRTLSFAGIGESDFHAQLDTELLAIPDLEVGYCARPSEVDLRLIGSNDSIEKAIGLVLATFREECFTQDEESLEEVVVKLLTQQGKKLSLAESCTGGRIASRITDVSGASAVFTHGFVTYANEAKRDMIGVSEDLIDTHGAVSEEVARAMAVGVRQRLNVDWGVSTTGIAGPDGGTPEKPVGTVCIGLAGPGAEVGARTIRLGGDRDLIRRWTVAAALDALRRGNIGSR
jgi:nicotinamide-nucleotide amidase